LLPKDCCRTRRGGGSLYICTDDGDSCASHRQQIIVDLGDGVDAAQSHGGEHFLAEDVERLGDAGLRQAIGLDAADHAGSGAQRQRVHHVLAEAEPRHPLI
jgi:hypothetical protein